MRNLLNCQLSVDKLTSEYTTVQTAFDNYMKAKADKERQTQLAKEFANITSKGLTPVPVYDVDGKVIAYTTREQAAQTVAQVPVNYGQTKLGNKLLYKKQIACQKTGDSTAVWIQSCRSLHDTIGLPWFC